MRWEGWEVRCLYVLSAPGGRHPINVGAYADAKAAAVGLGLDLEARVEGRGWLAIDLGTDTDEEGIHHGRACPACPGWGYHAVRCPGPQHPAPARSPALRAALRCHYLVRIGAGAARFVSFEVAAAVATVFGGALFLEFEDSRSLSIDWRTGCDSEGVDHGGECSACPGWGYHAHGCPLDDDGVEVVLGDDGH